MDHWSDFWNPSRQLAPYGNDTGTILSLKGSEEDLARVLSEELDSIAQSLDESPDIVKPQTGQKVFTVHLWPEEYDRRTLEQDLVRINFPFLNAAELKKKMKKEVRTIYTLEGTPGVDRLRASIGFSGDGHEGDPHLKRFPDSPFRNATPFESPEEARRAHNEVLKAFLDERRELEDIINQERSVIADRAVNIAQKRLEAARVEILSETKRYLGVVGRDEVQPIALLEGDIKPFQVLLLGADVEQLIEALKGLRQRKSAVDKASADFERERKRVEPPAHPLGLRLPLPGDMELLSHSTLSQAANDLTLALQVECRDFPILHRLWRTSAIPNVVRTGGKVVHAKTEAGGAAVADPKAGGTAIADLKKQIWRELRTSWQANNDLSVDLGEKPDLVWRYLPLIRQALEHLLYHDGSLEHRVAQERIAEENDMTLLEKAAEITAMIEMGVPLLAGPAAPEVMAALAAAILVLNVFVTVQQYLELREAEKAFNAVLDPSLALASEPGYIGFVVNVAMSLLDIKGVRDALRASRYAGERNVAETVFNSLQGT